MATDVEESDTDEHERPVPPKRQCMRIVNANESYNNLNDRANEPEERNNEECEYDEVEKLARAKLSIWQECQVAKGFLDNTINHVMENYILNPPVAYPVDDPEFRLFRGTDMEDTAVMMAIRNHGLVHTTDMVSQTQALRASRMSDRSTNDEHGDLLRSCSSSHSQETSDLSTLSLPSSSGIFDVARSVDIERRVGSSWTEDMMDENDREQDFLERAVAEAIKKKGLSALSVDYG